MADPVGAELDRADRVRAVLEEYGLIAPGNAIEVIPLAGGVSSSVYLARSSGFCVVLKQALPKLRVAQDWHAGVERSGVEAACAALLAELIPGAVPRPLFIDTARHAFVMECAPQGSETWKAQLLSGRVEMETAGQAGRLLGQIHRLTTAISTLDPRFRDRSLVEQLRIDPYLRATADRHPDLRSKLLALADQLLTTEACLVHGDFSPKNLLVAPSGRMLLVDHEVAHIGDPAFDLAFVLSHLCLKALRAAAPSTELLAAASVLIDGYRTEAGGQGAATLPRVPLMAAALMLARIDGKSPVEYLTADERGRIRSIARSLVATPAESVGTFLLRVGAAT